MKIIIPLAITAFLAVGCSEKTSDEHTQEQTVLKTIANIHTNKSCKMAFSQTQKLNNKQEDIQMLGKSFFTIPWVEAPAATTARDGLGPLFSANTCIHCHPYNGAGVPTDSDGKISRSLVMRLSIKAEKNINNDLMLRDGFIPEPTYGGQLSVNGTSDTPYEGVVDVTYSTILGKYDDGSSYQLQNPHYTISNLQYGNFAKNTNIAPHIGLALVGLGALEMIDEKTILAKEDIEDKNKDGISGKANWVYNPETNATELGRFTWKAASPSVKVQSANAAHNDMGLSNPLYPQHNCTDKQEECQKAIQGRYDFDLPMQRLDAITFYLKSLKIPSQRKTANFEKGKEIFNDLGCVKCHTPSYDISDGNKIHPYSDLLLHDMGDALSDGHTMFKADANEFRTPPLWGLGLYEKVSGNTALLHDGRARSIEEAILWHGGEAEKQKESFKALSKEKRDFLVEFIKGI
ncbi:MAG: di-heme oxidoredictase family protein [Campylobacterota bacterium]|nr:di-heme oxidoredictase family protein [Campylobacterota bacterium]